MGGRGSTSSGGGGSAGGSMNIIGGTALAATPAAALTANASVFSDTDTSNYHDLYGGRQYFQKQNLTIDQQLAVANYLSETPETGSLYSMSQNMNWNMVNGRPLTVQQQYVHDHLQASMHNVGYNINLTRYDHEQMVEGLLAANGLHGSYDSYSIGQMKSALVGTTFREDRFVSTSYNDFKNAGSSASTFNTRAVKITYQTKASAQGMMPGNGPGGSLGEFILAPGQTARVVDVKYSGRNARKQGQPKSSLRYKQVELVVEVG